MLTFVTFVPDISLLSRQLDAYPLPLCFCYFIILLMLSFIISQMWEPYVSTGQILGFKCWRQAALAIGGVCDCNACAAVVGSRLVHVSGYPALSLGTYNTAVFSGMPGLNK